MMSKLNLVGSNDPDEYTVRGSFITPPHVIGDETVRSYDPKTRDYRYGN